MRYIEKIRISKFRSIGPNESFEAVDLNILSGSNDSGKSNFLKALNLFFTGQTELSIRYNSENDFNKWFRDNNVRGERNIEIELRISKGNYGDKQGINKGFSARKTFRSDGGQETMFLDLQGRTLNQNSKSYNRANAIISERIRYVYVPAVRDVRFRESIQRLIQEIANSTDKRSKSKDLKDAFEKMELGIDNQLKGLTDYVKNLMNIEVETNVNFSTLLESLTFETSEKIKIVKRGKSNLETQKVSLRNRGDGIQMQFFSFLLWFISKNDKRHFYVWGYEEPEIAFEFKRQFELAEIFDKTFTRVAQIFLTTHSPAFAFCNAKANTQAFRVSYEKERSTKTNRHHSRLLSINEYYEGLFKELSTASGENRTMLERDIWGINAQKISRMIGESLDEVIGVRQITEKHLIELRDTIKTQQELNSRLEDKIREAEATLNQTYPLNIFICEDKTAINLWENLLVEKCGLNCGSFTVISSKGCTTNNVELAIEHLRTVRSGYNPTVFRQFDRDGYTPQQIEVISEAKMKKYPNLKYKIGFLPVNELENFAVLMESYFTSDVVKQFDNFRKLSAEFNGTITSNIQAVIKIVADEHKSLFNNTQKRMSDLADTDILRYYPGKEIKKLKNRFNPDAVLKQAEYSELPEELRIYLDGVRSYFERANV
jgi:predicted ATPase